MVEGRLGQADPIGYLGEGALLVAAGEEDIGCSVEDVAEALSVGQSVAYAALLVCRLG